MDTRKLGSPTNESARFAPDTSKVPETTMESAATYEQLLSCWVALKAKLDSSFADQIKEHGTLEFWLNNVYTCFSKPPYECDTGVKNIFENEDLRKQLKELDVPEEFLLHTVRIGAVKGIQNSLEKNPTQPVELYYDGTMSRLVSEEISNGRLPDPEAERERLVEIIGRVQHAPNIDGYSWANEQLRILVAKKTAEEEGKREEDARKIEADKERAVVRIQKGMREPGFHLAVADATLLRRDFEQKLVLWKAILESGVGRTLDAFVEAHGDKEITTEIFEQLKTVCDTDPAVKKALARYSLPLEIVNPDSGWFSVLIINKNTTLRKFFSSAYSNMNSWFQL